MNRFDIRSGLVALVIGSAGLASGAAQAAYVLTEVARPGATQTALWDINNAGTMVGYSLAGTGPGDFASAFVFDGSTYVGLAGPAGAVATTALGISEGGVVVGSYNTSSSVDSNGVPILDGAQGYIYSGGTYTSFNVAGALDTFLRGISPDGRYVSGYYSTTSQPGVGFVYDTVSGTLHTLSVPGSVLTIAQGINMHGVVAGGDILSGPPTTRPGFLYDIGTGTRTDLSIAGAARTALRSIADDGELAGWFIDGSGTHGFVGSITSHEVIDFAGATATFVEGSNNARYLVGEYLAADGATHAFIATPVPSPGTPALLATALAVALALSASARLRRGRTATQRAG